MGWGIAVWQLVRYTVIKGIIVHLYVLINALLRMSALESTQRGVRMKNLKGLINEIILCIAVYSIVPSLFFIYVIVSWILGR